MLIDDDVALRTSLVQPIESCGFTVIQGEVVEGPGGMIELLSSGEFAFGLFDHQLRGTLSTRAIHTHVLPRGLPFAVMTGRLEFSPPAEFTESACFRGLLRKPFGMAALAQILETIT